MSDQQQQPLQYESANTDSSLPQVAVYVGIILLGIGRLLTALNDVFASITFYIRQHDRTGPSGFGTLSVELIWMLSQPIINFVLGAVLIYFSSAIAAKCKYPTRLQITGLNFIEILMVAIIVLGLSLIAFSVGHMFYLANMILITYATVLATVGTTNYWLNILSPLFQLVVGFFLILRPGWVVGKILHYSRLEMPKPG